MSKQLVTDFLVELSINPQMLDRFETDPAGTVRAAGFSTEEAQVLISRDPDAVRQLLGVAAQGVAPDAKKKKKKAIKKPPRPPKKKK